MEKKNKIVVLAYSGGLDTSFCLKYLTREKGLEVHTALADTGGFSPGELKEIEEKAYELGAKKHVTLDVAQEYYDRCIRYMIYGNVLRNKTYPVSVSSERTFQALAIVRYARSIGADYLAHGSTGAGNDQVRFDSCFSVYAPEIEILTPTRDLALSRQAEIDYLKTAGVKRDWEKMEYSVNKGLWGTSIGGKETLCSDGYLPENAYPSPLQREGTELLTLTFAWGEIAAVNGEVFPSAVEAIRRLEEIASPWAIGRDTHVGDTIVGIKGRVGFEAAAPLLLIKGHELLEKHTLSKWQLYWKEQLANWYGMFLHEAMYGEPVMRDIEAFLKHSQSTVNGDVSIRLRPYGFDLLGVRSPNDLVGGDFASYGEANRAWTAEDVKGFTRILSIPLQVWESVNGDK